MQINSHITMFSFNFHISLLPTFPHSPHYLKALHVEQREGFTFPAFRLPDISLLFLSFRKLHNHSFLTVHGYFQCIKSWMKAMGALQCKSVGSKLCFLSFF